MIGNWYIGDWYIGDWRDWRSRGDGCGGCGEDKIIYGGESPIWHPQWALEAFWNFELPEELTKDYGYPPLTEQAKRKILGENLARLHGMDVAAKKKELGLAA